MADDRWETVNLKPDQLEQILATDVVETVRIDQAMAVVLSRLEGKPPPPVRTVRFGVPIAFCTLAIVLGGLALLLQGDVLRVQWRMAGIIGFAALAAMSGITALFLLIDRLRKR